MPNRYPAILLSLTLLAAFVVGLFLEPAESRADVQTGWVGDYFPNGQWQGEPLVTTADDFIGMNWFNEAPYEGLEADNFSVRWTSQQAFQPGVYRFRVGADGSITLLLDGVVLIELPETNAFTTITRDVRLPKGDHTLEVFYAETSGMAGALVDWTVAEAPQTIFDLETQTTETLSTTTSPQALAYIASSQTNVYKNPSLTAPRLAQVYLAQQYAIVGTHNDWLNIQLNDGSQGWIQARYVYTYQQ